MKSFLSFTEAKRRSKIRQDSKTGDEDGVNTKNDTVGTVSITDEKLDELSPELVGKVNKARAIGGKPSKTKVASQTLSHAVRKAWLKTKVGVQKEGITSTMGAVRSTPVNIGSSPTVKEPNAPSSASSLQKAADSRRQKLDTFAQKETESKTKQREAEVKKRQAAAKSNDLGQKAK